MYCSLFGLCSLSIALFAVAFMWCFKPAVVVIVVFLFFQAEDGIRDLVRSRGLGDVYKRQPGAVVTSTGLVYRSLTEGKGASPAAADRVKVHYLSLIHI